MDNSFYSNFDIHPSIVFQLGKDLISNPVQALIELIKNSYDADAKLVKIEVVSNKKYLGCASKFEGADGYIVIEDDGFGMNEQEIIDGWLTISNSFKKKMKKCSQTTTEGRTPLGDKGLGRLGVQRLGNNLEIFTKDKNTEQIFYVGFSWNDFLNKSRLADVKIEIQSIDKPIIKKGTRIIISDLIEPDIWDKGSENNISEKVSHIENELSRMISPYKEIQRFAILGSINGKKLEISELSEKVRETAEIRYSIQFDGQTFNIKGKARLNVIKPPNPNEQVFFRDNVEIDSGKRFLNYLMNDKRSKDYKIVESSQPAWFIEFQQSFLLNDITPIALVEKQPANPGAFLGEIDSFDLGATQVAEQNIFNRKSQYKEFVKNISGIRVYRDGFGIKVEKDWLKLGEQQTSGSSWYSLKPKNTIGYIALSAKENNLLEETTDREGFSKTPYYMNFYAMLQRFIKFTEDIQAFIRRSYNNFKKTHAEKVAGYKDSSNPERVISDLKKQMDFSVKNLQDTKNFVENSSIAQQNEGKILLEKIATVEDQLGSSNIASGANPKIELLSNQFESLKNQLNEVIEMVSLGITAEALSHEIYNIADRLANITQQNLVHIQSMFLQVYPH
jgi:hypothetical protein